MSDDVLLALEGLGADLAGEEPLVAVHVLLVDLQVAAVGEGLLAGLTAVRHLRLHPVVSAGGDGYNAYKKVYDFLCVCVYIYIYIYIYILYTLVC